MTASAGYLRHAYMCPAALEIDLADRCLAAANVCLVNHIDVIDVDRVAHLWNRRLVIELDSGGEEQLPQDCVHEPRCTSCYHRLWVWD